MCERSGIIKKQILRKQYLTLIGIKFYKNGQKKIKWSEKT